MSKKIMNRKLHVKNRKKNRSKLYYIFGTKELNDGLPCTAINFDKGFVCSPTFYYGYSNWRCVGAPTVKFNQDRALEEPIKGYSCYPAFAIYLMKNGLVRKWKQAGGKFIKPKLDKYNKPTDPFLLLLFESRGNK